MACMVRDMAESQRSPGAPEVSIFIVCCLDSYCKLRWSGLVWTLLVQVPMSVARQMSMQITYAGSAMLMYQTWKTTSVQDVGK